MKWQVTKRGVIIEHVNPGILQILNVRKRWLKYHTGVLSYGYESDRDIIAITNLNGKGSLNSSILR
ncbi:hypothetical protein B9Q01_06990 [Candidatus Marsarchaeota G1 archaeon OSP_D]|uniref:Uncharacterized protein n=2 Tax=Candidatus Marsarchaeota group 1 TaxID=2203770 RepID=A0A2R6AFN3_9ARCH|nr:MAG: hypothetical protein B9Q01_06990 [Candidatus Marsarchaeota G1 archaeon OSP_D]PSN85138.1 MAG: hypothetical protein B9Q02_07550 [Candidatus Marsarchaeota G1 archaeon BE_D]